MKKLKSQSKKLLADTLTPVSAYLKIRDLYPNSILLESTDFHHLENCFSFICLDPIAGFIVENDVITLEHSKTDKEKIQIENRNDVLDQLQKFINSYEFDSATPDYNGYFGYTSYDGVKYFETLDLNIRKDEQSIPEIRYHLFRYIIAFNHLKNEIIITENYFDKPDESIDELISKLFNNKLTFFSFQIDGEEKSNLTDDEYMHMVSKAKEHCYRGDVFQLVVSRNFSQKYKGDDFNVYRQLRSLNPSPYLFYFDYGSYRIFGSSPESQIVIKDNKASINPIAGTFRRTGDDEKDKMLASELAEDPKENAEHVMLVDLARNDLSRNADNVQVETYKEIQFYSHVIHIVSKVSGILINDMGTAKTLADSFPAGTLTGAPKFKAMELIDQYENTSRGYYGGCIGYYNSIGDTNHAITIRSFLSKNNTLYYQAGAGIVSQSVEEKELQEVNNKLMALKTAINEANN